MRNSPLFILVIVLVAMFATAGIAGLVYVNVRQFVIDSPIELPSPPQLGDLANRPTKTPTPRAGLPTNTPDAAMIAAGITPTVNPNNDGNIPVYSDVTRFTVVLLGIDQRPGEKGPFRTDTVMVLSFDPVRKSAAMLSIPRDVYVEIPGYASETINVANFIGDRDNYPGGGGPELARKTVERFLGIPIDRYIEVNFHAFNTIIDALGTIEVCPSDHILDTNYPETDGYGVITVEFQPGCQQLDSVHLLQYARVRHNAGDDFGRASRQQEVIKAIQKKVLSLGGVSSLIGQAGTLWAALKDNIRTDLTYDEILQLANSAQGVTIKSAVLLPKTDTGGQLLPSTLTDGRQVQAAVYEDVAKLVVQLFDAGQAVPENSQAQGEGAVLSVLNGAGIDGLAKRTADALTAKGFIITNVGNSDAPGSYGKSEIRVYTGKMNTARYLAEQLNLPGTVIVQTTDGPPGVDIVLIVGKDLAPQ